MNTKQVIVIRKDLKMRRGKEIAQGAHASNSWMSKKLDSSYNDYRNTSLVSISDVERDWIENSFTKVCVTVDSEDELIDIFDKADEAGLEVNIIEDGGKTEFKGVKTLTCLAIGPDISEKIDKITGHLKLY